MHDDNRPGRRLSRRELVGLFGASVAAVAATSRARDAGGAAIAGRGDWPHVDLAFVAVALDDDLAGGVDHRRERCHR